MIRNDKELTAQQEALGHIERALDSLRERVLPKNPRNFAIYAEAYIDQINILKTEIDEYQARKNAKVLDTAATPTMPSANMP